MSRRRFLKALGIGALFVGGGAAYSTWIEPRWVEVTRTKIPMANLPPDLRGFTIVQLSDFHHSRHVSAEYLSKCVDVANRQQPNLIALTGDYITGASYEGESSRDEVKADALRIEANLHKCIEILSSLKAPSGVYATLGNHDGWYDSEKVSSAIRKSSLKLLRDESDVVTVGSARLQIVGLRDLWTETINLDRAFEGLRAEVPTIVLMHNPDLFEEVAARDADLIMAGHTHGGQVALPFFGPLIVPSKFGRKYASGLFQTGGTRMYVNRGLGVIAPPVRFLVRPEISVFELVNG
jgi:predicted MPP superfamily phosphohydrolase